MSLIVLPVARLIIAIRVDDKASAIPLAVSPLSDVPSIESSVLLFPNRIVVHYISRRRRLPNCLGTEA